MKLLVIGGSYFYGRVFVMLSSKEHEVTVVNRGTYSMEGFGVKEVRGDRKDTGLWRTLQGDYDVAIDFCAYEKGDIARVLQNVPGKIRQYIFISTVDVYERGAGRPESGEKDYPSKQEEAPLETRLFPGEAGLYIAGKAALERELREECVQRGIMYTVIRPAILYGPFNYAPRESAYIQMIVQNKMIPHIKDAEGRFQMVYVKDAARAICKCLLNEQTYGQAYNLCQDQIVTYELLYEELVKAADTGPEELAVTVGEAQDMGIPLPFPATDQESELYSNEKSKRDLGMDYISFSEGMERTFKAFRGVFGGKEHLSREKTE